MADWLKLHRKLKDNPIIQDPHLLQVFIYCLCRASYKERKILFNGAEITLRPGDFIAGRHEASKDLRLKSKMWDRKILILQNLRVLTRKVTNQFSIISITNWDTYQSNEKQDDQVSDHRMTIGRPTDDQRMTTDKKEKKEKNKNKNIYGSFSNVKMTEEEKQKVSNEEIENLSLYLASKGDKYKSHYATILNFRRRNPHQAAKIEPKPKCPKCGKENAKSMIWDDGCSLCLRSDKEQLGNILKKIGG